MVVLIILKGFIWRQEFFFVTLPPPLRAWRGTGKSSGQSGIEASERPVNYTYVYLGAVFYSAFNLPPSLASKKFLSS